MNFLTLLQRNWNSADLDLDLDVNVKTTKLDLPDNKSCCSNMDNINNINVKLDTCQLCSSAESENFRQGSELSFNPQVPYSLVE